MYDVGGCGNKGRKKRRGRPTKQAQQRRQHRSGMSKQEQATFIWEHQYLIVRKEDDLSEQDKAELALLLQIAPELKRFRQVNQQFYRSAVEMMKRLINISPRISPRSRELGETPAATGRTRRGARRERRARDFRRRGGGR